MLSSSLRTPPRSRTHERARGGRRPMVNGHWAPGLLGGRVLRRHRSRRRRRRRVTSSSCVAGRVCFRAAAALVDRVRARKSDRRPLLAFAIRLSARHATLSFFLAIFLSISF